MLTDNISMRRTRVSLVFFLCASVLFSIIPARTLAQTSDIAVTPAVIDEKGKPRDILKQTITLTNTSDHVIGLFPTVEDVNPANGDQSFDRAQNSAELSDSLANWIELSRGVVTLGPGEQKEIPFIIRINLNAVPSTYHAHITFSTGETRMEAEAHRPLVTVAVNLEVQADIKEVMQLNKFTADNVVFTGDDVLFNYQLQNIGNQELEPRGEIRIYDRKGQEVAAIDVNREGRVVSPDQVAQLASVWSAANGFGKFKALLSVNYGRGQTASVQDTVFFWIIPWKQLLGLLIGSMVAIIILALYFHKWLEERHLGKLAHAGLLKIEEFAHIPHRAHAPAQTGPLPQRSEKSGMFSFVHRMKEMVWPSGTHVETEISLHNKGGPASLRNSFERSTITLSSPSRTEAGGTINLKQMRAERPTPMDAAAPSAPGADHGPVINLKKTQ